MQKLLKTKKVENKIPIFSFDVLSQLKGRVKFTQIIQINKFTYRGWNKDSNLIMEISIVPFTLMEAMYYGYAGATVGLGMSRNELFDKKIFVLKISTLGEFLNILHWKAEQILEFDF